MCIGHKKPHTQTVSCNYKKMKSLLTLIVFCLLFGCRTENKLETGELSVTGQYCKYPDNDFLVLPVELFKNETFVKSDTIEFSREAKFENLPYGKYKVKFETIYDRQESIEFEIESENQEITLCIDKIDYGQTESDLFIDKLKPDESLKIDFKTFGCFHFENSGLEIIRKNDQYLAILDKTEIVLSTAQLELVREFEIELREIQSGWCTTSDTYNLSVNGNSESMELIDESCSWRGFNNLLEKLKLKNNYS